MFKELSKERGKVVNNGDYIRENLANEMIVKFLYKYIGANEKCKECPVGYECNEIQEKLEETMGRHIVGCEDILTFWVNNGQDYFFYSNKPKRIKNNKMNVGGTGIRTCCLCGKSSRQVPVSAVSLMCSHGTKKLTDICENCYPKFCKILKVPIDSRIQPSFSLTSILPKKTKKPRQDYTICWRCGTRCSPKHNFCHECGERLDN